MAAPRYEPVPPQRGPRRVRVFFRGEALKCFNDHNLDAPAIIDHQVIPCRKTVGDSRQRFGRQCGQLLFTLSSFVHLRDEPPGILVTEVWPEELKALDHSGMTPRQVLRSLGLAL